MESFNFELKLVSNIEEKASRGATALKGVQSQGQKAQKALDWSANLGKQLERVGFASARAAKKQQDAFSAAWVKIGMAAERAAKQQQRAFERAVEKRMDRMQDSSMAGGIKEGLGVGKLTSAAFYGSVLAEGAFKMVDVLMEGIHKVVDTFEEGVSRAFEEAGRQQTLRIGERLSLGRAGGKEFRQDADRFSKLTGMDDDAIRAILLPLRRAGVNQQGARTAFAAASDVAAGEGRGGDAGRIGELVQAFTRIKLRGEVEDRFLSQIGVEQKGIYAELAKTLHISADAAKKRAAAGKIDPQVVLNAIYHGIEKQQGGKLGTGSIEVSKSFEARLARVKNLPSEYLKNLVDSPAFQRASDLMAGLLENLDPDSPAGQRIMQSVEHMFDRIAGFVGDPKDAADSLADKVEDVIGFAEQLTDDFRSWADALLPSLETLEDMVFAARKFKAITTADQVGLAAVNADQARSDQKRVARGVEKQLRQQDPQMLQDAVDARLKKAEMLHKAGGFYGPINMPAVEKAARADVEAQKNELRRAAGVNIVVQPGAVQVTGNPGDDDTHREVGDKLHKHVVRELGRAAQQGGG